MCVRLKLPERRCCERGARGDNRGEEEVIPLLVGGAVVDV